MAEHIRNTFKLLVITMTIILLLKPLPGMAAAPDDSSRDYAVYLLGQRELATRAPFSLRIIVHREDGSSAPGVPVEILLHDESGKVVSRFSSKTDTSGTLSPELSAPEEEGKGLLTIRVEAKEFVFPVIIKEKLHIEALAVIENAPSHRALGVKARLLVKPFFQPLSGRKVSISLADSSGKTLSRKDTVTNQSGMTFAELPLPSPRSGEQYNLQVLSQGVEQSFPLRLPDIEGDFSLFLDTGKKTAHRGDALTGTIKALYRDGRPVEGASFSMAITAKGREEKVLARLDRETDRDGSYRFRFVVPETGDEELSADRKLIFTIKAQKGAKKASLAEEIALSPFPYYLNLWAEKGLLKRGLSNKITVMALDGDFSPSPLRVTVTWGQEKKELNLSESGWAGFDYTGTGEKAEFTIIARDSHGAIMEKQCTVPVDSSKECLLTGTVKSIVKRGDTLKLECTSTVPTAPLFVDIMAGDGTVMTREARLLGGRASLEIPLDEHLAGFVTARAYFLQGGEIIDDETVIYVDPAAPARAEIAPLKERFIPGEMLPLLLTLHPAKDSSPYLDIMLAHGGRGEESIPPSELAPASPFPWMGAMGNLLASKNHAPSWQARLLPLLLSYMSGSPYTIAQIPSQKVTPEIPHPEVKAFAGVNRASSGDRLRQKLLLSSCGIPQEDSVKTGSLEYTDGRDRILIRLIKKLWNGGVSDDMKEALTLSAQFRRTPDGSFPELASRPMPKEVYFYEPLIKADEQHQAKKDIRLPSHNFQGTVIACPSSGGLYDSKPIAIYQQYLCDIPLLYSTVTSGDSLALPVRLVNYRDEDEEIALEISKRPWFTLGGERTMKRTMPGKSEGLAFFMLNNLEEGTGKIAVASNLRGDIQEVRGELYILPRASGESMFKGGVAEKDFRLLLHFPEDSHTLGRKTHLILSAGIVPLSIRAHEALQAMDMVTSEALVSRILLALYLNALSEASGEEKEEGILQDGSELAHFERTGGGFSRFKGDDPGCLATARVLMALHGMARQSGGNNEPESRNRKWILEKRAPDGSWSRDEGLSGVSTTAFITWMLEKAGSPSTTLEPSMDYLWHHRDEIQDSFTLAIVTALLKNNMTRRSAAADMERLLHSKVIEEKATMHWNSGHRFPGDVVTTALAVMAIDGAALKDDEKKKIARFLLEQQEPEGSWGPSEETLLVIEALAQLLGNKPCSGTVALEIQGKQTHAIKLGADDRKTCRKIDLSDYCNDKNTIDVAFFPRIDGPLFYQIVEKYFVPHDKASGDVVVTRSFSAPSLKKNEKTECTILWSLKGVRDLAVLKIPLPWGFRVDRDFLEREKQQKKIALYRLSKHDLFIYMRMDKEEGKLIIPFTALLACTIGARPVEVFDYYHGTCRGRSNFMTLTVH
jgi:hypothetical protein